MISREYMAELDPKISELEARLDSLVRTQIGFQQEISTIRRELSKLRGPAAPTVSPAVKPPITPIPPQPAAASQSPPPPHPRTNEPGSYVPPPSFGQKQGPPRPEGSFSSYVATTKESARTDLEKFIGENLISKIGIVILILGVGIGAKYAIDNGWINPVMRIVFGYVIGVGLLGFAAKLKAKYLNFSSVLLSGGMAILYFVTYFAYAYYSLIPQLAAFILMAMFTAFTVAAALLYERQVIAHIGLVGAYAVPFLLSNNSGNYLFLFSYMVILNGGILAVSIKKYWKSLFYTSFIFTWIIFFGWFVNKYSPAEHFTLALVFLAVFFAIFYAMKVIHGVRHSENDDPETLISIIVNGFVFYSFAYAISTAKLGIGEYTLFFSYLGAISLVILLTSFKFYGKALIYLSYPFTCLIFGTWFVNYYNADEYFVFAAVFAGIFFAIYYFATLIYRLWTDEICMVENAGLVLINSFIFYGFGYAIMDSRESLQPFAGLFTVAHALFHSVVAQIVSRIKVTAVDAVQVLAVLIITFATIAVPVQFDGTVVTLVWTVEAAVLFWFGRARAIPLFEYFSYPLMVLATGSLFVNWINSFMQRPEILHRPFANADFITAIVFVAAFAFIYIINRDDRHGSAIDTALVRPFGVLIGAVGLFVLYNLFRLEIHNYFLIQIAQADSFHADGYALGTELTRDHPLLLFNSLWQLNYTILFLTVMAGVNIRKVRSSLLAYAGILFSCLILFIFTTAGMYLFYQLRLDYEADASSAGVMSIAIRYISYLYAAGLLYSLFAYSKSKILTESMSTYLLELGFDGIFYLTLFISASCELVNLMAQLSIPDANKLGLSILWGIYALALIVIGIGKNKKHLRIAAIVLLAATLVKLFFYDVANLPTIPKTILFISLGSLMLIVSFLYNKYKNLIFKFDEESGSGS